MFRIGFLASHYLMYQVAGFDIRKPAASSDGRKDNLNAVGIDPFIRSDERHHNDNDCWAKAGLGSCGYAADAARDHQADPALTRQAGLPDFLQRLRFAPWKFQIDC